METVTLNAKKRESFGKSVRNQIRKAGRVPGVYYSRHDETIPLEVSRSALNPLVFSSATHIILLKLEDGKEFECVIKDVQFDPITDEIIHFDLMGLTRGEKFQLEVPVQLVGTAKGVKEGGILQHMMHKLEIECLPKHIPQHIEVDITNLGIGDAIYVRDIKADNIEILNPEDSIIVSVTHAKVEVEETAEAELAEGEEMQEPEVIEKGKESEEDKEAE